MRSATRLPVNCASISRIVEPALNSTFSSADARRAGVSADTASTAVTAIQLRFLIATPRWNGSPGSVRRNVCFRTVLTQDRRMSGGNPGPPPGKPGSKRGAVSLQLKLPCASLDDVKARYPELQRRLFPLRLKQPLPI